METGESDLGGVSGEIAEVAPAEGNVPQSSEPKITSGGIVSGRGTIISGRGTADGLAVRLDGRIPKATLLEALNDFFDSRIGFLSGSEVTLEWIAEKPEQLIEQEIIQYIEHSFRVRIRGSQVRDERRPLSSIEEKRQKPGVPPLGSTKSLSLFDGIEVLKTNESEVPGAAAGLKSEVAGDAFLWDDPDARIVYGTLRSGQKIESEHSMVVVGDVNSGAELIAGGDIIVLGTLRGVAHAGAYDETGGGRFIFALNLKPTQLRIGSVISRGGADISRGGADGRSAAEIARIDGNNIVVEPFQAKNVWGRK